jgi:hypothetical protein
VPAAGAAADSSDQKGDKGQVRASTAGRVEGEPLHGTAGRRVGINHISVCRTVPGKASGFSNLTQIILKLVKNY